MARIGIVGGTFDPIHEGHLFLGRQAKKEYGLDEVWFMPSGQPPHKTDHFVTEVSHRCNMVKLALEGEDGAVFSDFEAVRQGKTYTAQTVALLKERWPMHRFFFILGSDSLYQIENWYHPEQILGQVDILAARRREDDSYEKMEAQILHLKETYGGWIETLHGSEIEISSEEIRCRIQKGESIKGMVPAPVEDYIQRHGLYQLGGSYGSSNPEISETIKETFARKPL